MSNWAIDGKSLVDVLKISGGGALSVEARKEISMRALGQEPVRLSDELKRFIDRACLGRVEIRGSGLRK